MRYDLEPGLPSPSALGEGLLEDALLEEVGALPVTPTAMGRAHSAALPASPFAHSIPPPASSGMRRATSAARGGLSSLDLAPDYISAASAPPLAPLAVSSPSGSKPPRPPVVTVAAAGPLVREGDSDAAALEAELRTLGESPYEAFFAGL